MQTVSDVLRHLESSYPRRLAEAWDSVGLIAGSWHWPVTSILISVDVDSAVVDEAIAIGADLVVSHHPLALPRQRGPRFDYKTRTAQRALAHGIALANAHTNADLASPGVSDALAEALGLLKVAPLVPLADEPGLGIGRVGELPDEISLSEFVELVGRSVPRARTRSAGPLDARVRRVGLVGGSGDAYLSAAKGCDVYVTSDLRHHPVAEHLESGGCPVVDINHQAAEALWLPQLAQVLGALGVRVTQSACDTAHWN